MAAQGMTIDRGAWALPRATQADRSRETAFLRKFGHHFIRDL